MGMVIIDKVIYIFIHFTPLWKMYGWKSQSNNEVYMVG